MLSFDSYGTEGPRLLIAHGLFGSARNWGAIARRMGKTRQVTVPDMRNHGASFWSETNTYDDLANDLAPLAGGDVIGHSMGGKAAMALALSNPSSVRRLVVADIAPVAYSHSHAHLITAMQALRLGDLASRSAADEKLSRDVDDPAVRAFLLQSLDLKEKRWLLNLDVLAREMGTITGWREIDSRYDGPTLFLSGGASDYVPRDARAKILSMFPQAKFASIPGTGHWLHAEKPREFIAAVEAFFDLTVNSADG